MILHCGIKSVTRTQLACVPCPEGTATWKPVPHFNVLELVYKMLEASGFRVHQEQLGLTRDQHRFFGTIDLRNELAPGVVLSVGIRNSTDRSLPLGFCAGNRVIVCDNLSFSSELMVKHKHSKNCELRFTEAITLAVFDLKQFQEAETRRIQLLQTSELGRHEAEAYMLTALELGILSARSLPVALKHYRKPQVAWGSRNSAWFLFNCIAKSLQPRAKSNPQAFALSTIQLVTLFFPSGDVKFNASSSELGFVPNDADIELSGLPGYDHAEAYGTAGNPVVPEWL